MQLSKIKKSLKPHYSAIIFHAALFIGGILLGLYTWKNIKPLEILEVKDTMTYGEVTLLGIVHKDYSFDPIKGDYFLTIPEGEVIFLDSISTDDFTGLQVMVTGVLNPPDGISNLPIMTVSNIETQGSQL